MKVKRFLLKKQITWNILKKVSQFTPTTIFKDIPDEIIIEPTNSCNLRCPVCPTHFAMKRKKGFLEFDLFKSIIDEFKDIKKKPRISMNFSGEPLLNKDIPLFVEYASKNGHQTMISTNCTIMPKEMVERLVKAGLSDIHLAIDGFSKKSQEAYRVGSDFDAVKENVEIFLKTKHDMKANKPYVTIQTLLTAFSEPEMEAMTQWAKDIKANQIQFKSLSMGSYTSKEMQEEYKYLLPKEEIHLRKYSSINKTVCRLPEKQALVYWNGDLGLCCVDFDNVVKLPNIKEKGFLNTYFSEEVINKRKLGFQKGFDLCKTCSMGNADNFGFDIRTYEDDVK